jgi:inosose dehydratase
MTKQERNRRAFLADTGLAAAAILCGSAARGADQPRGDPLHVAINQWSVGAVRGRDKNRAGISFDAELAGLAADGLNGLEPGLGSAEQIEPLVRQLAGHGLEMRSIYTGSVLHDGQQVAKEIGRITELGKRAAAAGVKIIVTNPSPLPAGQPKSDPQLKTQAGALNRLGEALASLGLVLAYHTHDPELRCAAREFHHMLLSTEPRCLSLCLDAHWVYRGAGNSLVALMDIVKLYGRRIVELHLRQSHGNVWSEVFGDGDIDYRELAKKLAAIGVKPHLVLEQGPERGTPQTMDAAEIHRRSCRYVHEVFAGFQG